MCMQIIIRVDRNEQNYKLIYLTMSYNQNQLKEITTVDTPDQHRQIQSYTSSIRSITHKLPIHTATTNYNKNNNNNNNRSRNTEADPCTTKPSTTHKQSTNDRGQLSKYVHHKRINANNRNMSYYEKLKSMINNQDKQHEWGYQHHYGHRDYRKYQHTVNNSNTDNNNTKDINANDDGQGNNNHISSNNKKYQKINQYLNQYGNSNKADTLKPIDLQMIQQRKTRRSNNRSQNSYIKNKRKLIDPHLNEQERSKSKNNDRNIFNNNSINMRAMPKNIQQTTQMEEQLPMHMHVRAQSDISISKKTIPSMSIDKSSKKTYNISNKGKSPTTKSTHKYAYNNTCIKTLIPINGDAGAKTDIKSKQMHTHTQMHEHVYVDKAYTYHKLHNDIENDVVVNLHDIINQLNSKQVTLPNNLTNIIKNSNIGNTSSNINKLSNISTRTAHNNISNRQANSQINPQSKLSDARQSFKKMTPISNIITQVRTDVMIVKKRVVSNNYNNNGNNIFNKNQANSYNKLHNGTYTNLNTTANFNLNTISNNANIKNRLKYQVINYNKYTPYPLPFNNCVDPQSYLPICNKWGKMQLLQVLGSGANAIVREGVCQGFKYAIKIYEKYKLIQPRKKKRVYTQIQLLKNIPIHPNIITMHQAFQDKRQIHVIFQHLNKSVTLHQHFRNNMLHLESREIRKIFGKLARGLSHLHQSGVAHRDIKPENVLICYQSDNSYDAMDEEYQNQYVKNRFKDQIIVKIIDFGFATTTNSADLACGTPNFMAPQLLDKSVKYNPFSVDVWALGITLFYLYEGRYPFKGYDERDLYRAIKSGKYEYKKIVQPEIIQIINAMLNSNPKERITAKQLVRKNWVFNCHEN